jgi:hypothetical protein
MDYPTLRRIASGLTIAVLIAAGIVFSGTMYVHARHDAARADRAEHKLASTRLSLELTRNALGETGTMLHTTQDRLASTTQALSRTTGERATLQGQSRNCRYLVAVNDHLMGGMAAYDRATGFLLDGRRRRAGYAVAWAGRHLNAIQALVRRSGHRTISDLVNACAPPTRG